MTSERARARWLVWDFGGTLVDITPAAMAVDDKLQALVTDIFTMGGTPRVIAGAAVSEAWTARIRRNSANGSDISLMAFLLTVGSAIGVPVTQPRVLAERVALALRDHVVEYGRIRDGLTTALSVGHGLGWRHAVFSNTILSGSHLASVLQGMGVDEWFVRVLTSADVGLAKPNPEAFRTVASLLGAMPRECVYVGNDVSRDGAAEDAGMQLCLLRAGSGIDRVLALIRREDIGGPGTGGSRK